MSENLTQRVERIDEISERILDDATNGMKYGDVDDWSRVAMNLAQQLAEIQYLEENGVLTTHGQDKYAIFSIPEQESGFLGVDGKPIDTDLQNAALYTDETAKVAGIDISDESKYIMIPLSQKLLDKMPYDLADTAPDIMNTTINLEGIGRDEDEDALDFLNANPDLDFVVLTEYGFYDEKYNSSTNTSRPKVRSFELDYANLYNKGNLREDGILYKTDDMNPIIIPISKIQQEALQQNSAFSAESEPFGFFFEPIGDTVQYEETSEHEEENLMDFGAALDGLQYEQVEEEGLPF